MTLVVFPGWDGGGLGRRAVDDHDVLVLERYSSNEVVAACVSGFGKGWVGLVGLHPEANESWCEYFPFFPFLTSDLIKLIGIIT